MTNKTNLFNMLLIKYYYQQINKTFDRNLYQHFVKKKFKKIKRLELCFQNKEFQFFLYQACNWKFDFQILTKQKKYYLINYDPSYTSILGFFLMNSYCVHFE